MTFLFLNIQEYSILCIILCITILCLNDKVENIHGLTFIILYINFITGPKIRLKKNLLIFNFGKLFIVEYFAEKKFGNHF